MVTFPPAPPCFEPIHSISTLYNPASRAAAKVVKQSLLSVAMVTLDRPLKPIASNRATSSSTVVLGDFTMTSLRARDIERVFFAGVTGFAFFVVSVGAGAAVGSGSVMFVSVEALASTSGRSVSIPIIS